MQYRACVLSLDEEFAQFVRLTLLERVRPVSIATPDDIPNADIYVVDLDTVPTPPALNGKVLWCSAHLDKPDNCSVLWADRPFRPARLLALLDLAVDIPSARLLPYRNTPAVLVGEDEIMLSAREHTLLLALWDANGEFLTREELIDRVWHGEDVDSGVVNVYIHYLRRKLEANGQRCIYVARGRGYRLERGNDEWH